MAMAPIDCAGCLSNTGRKVVPPFTDFQTPPLAEPTYTVSRPFSCTAATAAIRPLIAAAPMLRAPSPEMVLESILGGGPAGWAVALTARVKARIAADPQMARWVLMACPLPA